MTTCHVTGDNTIWATGLSESDAKIRAQHLSLEWAGIHFEVRNSNTSARVVGYTHGNVSAPKAIGPFYTP